MKRFPNISYVKKKKVNPKKKKKNNNWDYNNPFPFLGRGFNTNSLAACLAYSHISIRTWHEVILYKAKGFNMIWENADYLIHPNSGSIEQ